MRKLFIKIIGQIISISIFVGIFMFSLFITYGYRYDFEENEVVQTSVIDLCTVPKQADLYLDGEFYSTKACEKIYGIDIGAHKLEVKKDGYYTWNKNLYLDREKASLYSEVLLIPRPEFYTTTILEESVGQLWISPNQSRYAMYDPIFNVIKIFSASKLAPQILEVPANIKNLIWMDSSRLVADTVRGRYEVNINKGDWMLVDQVIFQPRIYKNDLVVDGCELWTEDKSTKNFVTRYSVPIQSAQYFYNRSNLLITTENDIRVCDFEGENCHIITTKDAGTPVASPSRSKKIIFIKDGMLKQITLNGPGGDYVEINL